MAATKLRIFQDALRLLADARLDVITDDTESQYELTDAWDEAVEFVLRQAAWRFALTVTGLFAGGVAAPGYAHSFSYPSGWLRTHSIYTVIGDGREFPVDLRDTARVISANVPALLMRFVSSVFADPGFAPWPEHFAQAAAAYLAFLVADRVTGEHGASSRMSQLFSQLLGEAARVDAEPDDRWLPYQRNGELLAGARDLLGRGAWRFALATKKLPGVATLYQGLPNRFALPTDWLMTYSVYVVGDDGRNIPLDMREETNADTGAPGFIYARVPALYVRYVSSAGIDATRWPDPFRTALMVYLEAGRPQPTEGDKGAQAPQPAGWERALAEALATCAEPPDTWLRFQRSGDFASGARLVLQEGYWAWRDPAGVMRGLHEKQYSYLDDQVDAQPAYGFPYRYPLPADHFKTHALFVPWDGEEAPINIVETGHDWSTDAETFVARYLSDEVLDAALWPELVQTAVQAFLVWQDAPKDEQQMRAQEYAVALAEAKKAHSRDENPWLRFQLDRSFEAGRKELLEKGRWRFAVKTTELTASADPLPSVEAEGTVSPSYAYRFILPNDLIRTLRVYYGMGLAPWERRIDIDYRDEQEAIHAQFNPVTIRYVSRMGLDATKWPAHFRDALLAWLQYREARGDPAKTAVAGAKLAAFQQAMKEAEELDDARDRPAIIRGRISRSRRGLGPRAREEGWYLLP